MSFEAVSTGPSLPATLRRMIDPDYGLANRLVELGASAAAPDLFVTCVEGGAGAYMVDHTRPDWANCSNASGAAYKRTGAFWATLGELAERYCASIYHRAGMTQSTSDALGARVLPVEQMILFAKAQYAQPGFAFKPFSTSQTHHWCSGTHLNSGAEISAPAQLVYLSNEWADDMLMQTVSTGLACHSDPEAARLSAILELIERDGFAAAWALGMGLPHLELSNSERLQLSLETQRALANDGLRVKLYGLPNAFGVANIVAIVEDRKRGVGAFGAAAALSPIRAIEKAMLEAQHTWVGLAQSMPSQFSQQGRDGNEPKRPDPRDVKTPHDHAQYYMHPETWAQLDWFVDGNQSLTLTDLCGADPVKTCAALVERLGAHGHQTYLFDVTTQDIRSLGLQVLRALIPGLQPLCFGDGVTTEDRRRLIALAEFWDVPMPEELTKQPHPFP